MHRLFEAHLTVGKVEIPPQSASERFLGSSCRSPYVLRSVQEREISPIRPILASIGEQVHSLDRKGTTGSTIAYVSLPNGPRDSRGFWIP